MTDTGHLSNAEIEEVIRQASRADLFFNPIFRELNAELSTADQSIRALKAEAKAPAPAPPPFQTTPQLPHQSRSIHQSSSPFPSPLNTSQDGEGDRTRRRAKFTSTAYNLPIYGPPDRPNGTHASIFWAKEDYPTSGAAAVLMVKAGGELMSDNPIHTKSFERTRRTNRDFFTLNLPPSLLTIEKIRREPHCLLHRLLDMYLTPISTPYIIGAHRDKEEHWLAVDLNLLTQASKRGVSEQGSRKRAKREDTLHVNGAGDKERVATEVRAVSSFDEVEGDDVFGFGSRVVEEVARGGSRG